MSPRAGGPLPGARYRVIVTEISPDDSHVIYHAEGDAFIAGVAALTGARITATTDHDGPALLQERLLGYLTDAVEHPR